MKVRRNFYITIYKEIKQNNELIYNFGFNKLKFCLIYSQNLKEKKIEIRKSYNHITGKKYINFVINTCLKSITSFFSMKLRQ